MSRAVFDGIRKITEAQAPRVSVVKDKQGKLLTGPDQVKERWAEHFSELYNPHTVTDSTVLSELPVNTGRDRSAPLLLKEEVEAAIAKLKRNKSPGAGKITAEEILAAGQQGVDTMYDLCRKMWEEEEVPNGWKQSVIVAVFKKKDRLSCDNYRGISLLPHCEKLLATAIQLQLLRKVLLTLAKQLLALHGMFSR